MRIILNEIDNGPVLKLTTSLLENTFYLKINGVTILTLHANGRTPTLDLFTTAATKQGVSCHWFEGSAFTPVRSASTAPTSSASTEGDC